MKSLLSMKTVPAAPSAGQGTHSLFSAVVGKQERCPKCCGGRDGGGGGEGENVIVRVRRQSGSGGDV